MPVTQRPGNPADSHADFTIFERTVADLPRRLAMPAGLAASDPEAVGLRRGLCDHLARTGPSPGWPE
ncbi:MAG: hypothetical protein IT318_13755 [Anaerolineales bacterium]|nr:hypothetical protein [Anaerolineales bacterium]